MTTSRLMWTTIAAAAAGLAGALVTIGLRRAFGFGVTPAIPAAIAASLAAGVVAREREDG
jgi:hypothetical protein